MALESENIVTSCGRGELVVETYEESSREIIAIRDTTDREDQGIRSAAIPDPGRKIYYSNWHFDE